MKRAILQPSLEGKKYLLAECVREIKREAGCFFQYEPATYNRIGGCFKTYPKRWDLDVHADAYALVDGVAGFQMTCKFISGLEPDHSVRWGGCLCVCGECGAFLGIREFEEPWPDQPIPIDNPRGFANRRVLFFDKARRYQWESPGNDALSSDDFEMAWGKATPNLPVIAESCRTHWQDRCKAAQAQIRRAIFPHVITAPTRTTVLGDRPIATMHLRDEVLELLRDERRLFNATLKPIRSGQRINLFKAAKLIADKIHETRNQKPSAAVCPTRPVRDHLMARSREAGGRGNGQRPVLC